MMIGRHRLGVLVTALFALTLSGSTALQAQQTASARYRVLVPDFQPMNDEDDDFGKDLAEELRELIDDMLTHSAVDEDDIEDALDKYGFDMEDANCITSIQLAAQENYQVVLCAQYSGSRERWSVQNIRFVDVASQEQFDVEDMVSARDFEEQTAREIVARFELFVEQQRVARFCDDYAQSQQWDNALTNCDRALELNPNANTSRYTRASVLRQMERYAESLDETQRVLEADPFHTDALLLGGFLATNLERRDVARGLYNRYLELDPNRADVRMNVAYDLAQQGDPLGGMLIIEAGVALAPDNVDFYEQLGNFAFAGAEGLRREAEAGGGDGLTPRVREIYGKAIAAYERVFQEKGAEMLVSQLRNVTAAQVQLGNLDDAISFGERAIASHPGEASLRDIYSRALKDSGRIPEAIEALAAIEEINPDWPNLHLLMGSWMIEEERLLESVPVLEKAVMHGATPDAAANMVFAHVYTKHFQPTDGTRSYPRFIELIPLAKQFDVSREVRQQYDFFHGYALLSHATVLQEPQTAESATRTIPMFQEAGRLFEAGKGYADRTAGLEYQQLAQNVAEYIEIQELVIQRANRR